MGIELILAVGPQIAIAKIMADFDLAVAKVDCQTAKFNSLPNFLATVNYS